MRFKDIFKTALFKFSDYPTLLLTGNFKTFLYVAFLALIMTLGITAKLLPLFTQYGGIAAFANKEMPEFSIEDGRLSCQPYFLDEPDAGTYIKIDPSIEGEGVLPNGYPQAMVITATDIATRNNYRVQRSKFSDMPDFDKAAAVELLKKYEIRIYIFCAIILILAFMFNLAVNMLVYAILAHISNIILIHAPITFGAVFKLTVFASTLSVILNTLFGLVGIRSIEMIAPFITMFYVIKGMLQCRNSDGIIIEVLE